MAKDLGIDIPQIKKPKDEVIFSRKDGKSNNEKSKISTIKTRTIENK